MKANLAIVCVVLTIGVVVCCLLNSGQILARQHHDRGFKAGECIGFDKGYRECWNSLGMRWLGSHNRFLAFTKKYGMIHETPWQEFTIEEKVTIAMYGGSGSKLELEEIEEWANKYGVR